MPGARFQPRGRPQIRADLIGRVVGALFSNNRVEISGSGVEVALFGNPALSPALGGGYARKFVAADSTYALISPPPGIIDFSQTKPFTIVCVFTVETLGIATRILSYRNAANASGIQLGYTTNSRLGYWVGSSSGSASVAASNAALEIGRLYSVVFGYDGGHFMYLNGVRQSGSSAATFNTSNAGANTDINIGRRNTGGSHLDGSVLLFAHIDGAPDPAALSLNPWQIFDAEDEYVGPVATDQALPVSAAALLLSGGEVAMRISRRVAVQAAQMQVSGADVAIPASRRIGVQPAALSFTEGQVDLRAGRRLVVSAADLVLQPGAAQMRAVRRLAVAPASAVLAGGTIEFVHTPVEGENSYSIPVSPAALALTRGSVTMRVTRRMLVDAAQLAIGAEPVRMTAARRHLVSPVHLALAGGGVTLRFSAESPPLDIAKVHPSRVVIFEGSGSKVVVFEGSGSKVVVFEGSGKRMRFNDMSAKVPIKVGDKWITDRDRDEISYYAADITDELADRNTTAIADEVTALVYGVEILEGPELQVAMVGEVERTFVVVMLGDVDGDIPGDWRWVARVPCANGERFDRTTWFNEVDP